MVYVMPEKDLTSLNGIIDILHVERKKRQKGSVDTFGVLICENSKLSQESKILRSCLPNSECIMFVQN